MHKALQVELQDWQRDQEPDTDHEGFYQTSLPTIITQVTSAIKTSDKYNHRSMTWSKFYTFESFFNKPLNEHLTIPACSMTVDSVLVLELDNVIT